jgi:hypothetical protein
MGPVRGSHEHNNEPIGSTKDGNFLLAWRLFAYQRTLLQANLLQLS